MIAAFSNSEVWIHGNRTLCLMGKLHSVVSFFFFFFFSFYWNQMFITMKYRSYHTLSGSPQVSPSPQLSGPFCVVSPGIEQVVTLRSNLPLFVRIAKDRAVNHRTHDPLSFLFLLLLGKMLMQHNILVTLQFQVLLSLLLILSLQHVQLFYCLYKPSFLKNTCQV